MIEQQWAKHGGIANIAVSAGPSNLVILDEDAPGELERWCATYGITLPDTYEVTTGRGRHLYYRWDHTAKRIGNSPKAMEGFKIDVRGHGGYAIAEGSRHESGATYTSDGAPIVDLPAQVAGILLEGAGTNGQAPHAAATAEAVGEDPNTARIEFHQRHNALVRYAGRLRHLGLDHTEAEAVYRQRWLLCEQPAGQIPEARFHSAACPYPVTWEEAQAKLRDVFDRYAAGKGLEEEPLGEPLGDDRLSVKMQEHHGGQIRIAYRLARCYAGRLLYVHGFGWFSWDGKRWAEDHRGTAERAVINVIAAALAESAKTGDDYLRKDAMACESASGVKGVLSVARALEPFAAAVDDLDADPWLLNVANGTVDLHTIELRPASPADRITKVCRGAYHADAAGPVWTAFLAQVLPDAEVRGFVQRLAGLSLLGEVREHVLPIFTGTRRQRQEHLLQGRAVRPRRLRLRRRGRPVHPSPERAPDRADGLVGTTLRRGQ